MQGYVITIMDNENSVKAAKRCIKSAKMYGLNVEMHPATTPKDNPFDIMKSKNINPDGFVEKYSRHENCMSAFLSHYSLWEKCAFENDTYVIFEHDAVVVNTIPDDTNVMHVATIGKPSYGQYNTPASFGFNPLTQKPYFGGAHAYMVKPSGAWALMETAQSDPMPTDVYMHRERFPWLQEYYPWCAEAYDSFTTIQKDVGCLAKHNYNKDTYVIENV